MLPYTTSILSHLSAAWTFTHSHARTPIPLCLVSAWTRGAQVLDDSQVMGAPAPLPPPGAMQGSRPEMRTEMQEDDWMDAYLDGGEQSAQLQEELQAQLQLLL